MSLHIIENNILEMEVDAIVDSTNENLHGYSGVDKLIHEIGGAELETACRELCGKVVLGEAAHTKAFNLQCKHIIHTVCPFWQGGSHGEEAILRSCYHQSLEVAEELGCKSVAFPLISAGSMGFPITKAYANAVTSINEYLELCEDLEVYLVICGEAAQIIQNTTVDDLDEFINENIEHDSYERTAIYGNIMRKVEFEPCESGPIFNKEIVDLDDTIIKMGETFVEMMYRFMDERGIQNPATLYKKAGVSKATYSKLIKGGSKRPSIETAVALAMALELSYDEAVEFLRSAGLALSNSDKFDLIVQHFLKIGNYDIWELDVQLYKYGCKTLTNS